MSRAPCVQMQMPRATDNTNTLRALLALTLHSTPPHNTDHVGTALICEAERASSSSDLRVQDEWVVNGLPRRKALHWSLRPAVPLKGMCSECISVSCRAQSISITCRAHYRGTRVTALREVSCIIRVVCRWSVAVWEPKKYPSCRATSWKINRKWISTINDIFQRLFEYIV